MKKIVPLAIGFSTFGHSVLADEGSFNLYRSSALDASMRIYIAEFNSTEGADYNFENCWVAADLFESQDGVMTKFWCEPAQKEN